MLLLMQELYASLECVYHVSERVFTMSPVYTPSLPANYGKPLSVFTQLR